MAVRKGHSANIRAIRMTNYAVRDLAVMHTLASGDKGVKMINIKSHNEVPVGITLAKAMSIGAFKWSIYLAVFGRRQDGQQYMKSEIVDTQARYKQADLTEFLNAKHTGLIDGFNERHFCNVGWIATPYEYDLDEKKAGAIFDKFGAWDYLARWEIDDGSS